MGVVNHDIINIHFSFPFYLAPLYDIKRPFHTSGYPPHPDLHGLIIKHKLAI